MLVCQKMSNLVTDNYLHTIMNSYILYDSTYKPLLDQAFDILTLLTQNAPAIVIERIYFRKRGAQAYIRTE